MNYKSFLEVDTDDIIVETQNMICFERLMQEFDSIFGYTLQEGQKLELFKIIIIQSEHGISIDQKGNIIKNTIQ